MKKVFLTLTAMAVTIPLFGASWMLIDNFQQFNADEIYLNAEEIGWHARSISWTNEYWMLEDPHDSENIGMYVESGNYGVGYGSVYSQKELPGGGIAPGTVGTLFFRCLWSGLGNNWHMGTQDSPLAYDDVTGLQTAPGAWGDFNALIRLGLAVNLEHRDGGGYVSTNPPVILDVNIWYNFWMVVDNAWDMSTTPPTSLGVHTLYFQSPDDSGPVLIPVGTDPAKDSAFIRRAPVDADGNPRAIVWACFATESGAPDAPNPGDPFLLDDFYFSQGQNLSNPLVAPTEWAGYPIENEAGDVDTGDWLGWINVTSEPYIYIYGQGWTYMVEPLADAAGAWAYIYK